ncbi:hypothetical protein [Methylobacterium fujisawaense]
MISERAASANRRNAQASTGPRTLTGKARSGQNARKHGLSVAEPAPRAEAEIERLAEFISGEYRSDPVILDSPRAVAEAQLHIQRVKIFKIALLRGQVLAQKGVTDQESYPSAEISEEVFVQLERLERYERRALSRRKFAVRRFYELFSRVPWPHM